MVPGLALVPQSHGYNVYPGLAVQPSVSFLFSGQESVTTELLVHAWLLIFVFVSQACRSFFFFLPLKTSHKHQSNVNNLYSNCVITMSRIKHCRAKAVNTYVFFNNKNIHD